MSDPRRFGADGPTEIVTPEFDSLDDLRSTGVLWAINCAVFHPRGFALALHRSESSGEIIGWSIVGDGTEPWTFLPDGPSPTIDECFAAFEALLSAHRTGS